MHEWNECDLPRMREALLDWHDQNARDLPWRFERDPYRIWLSEIMLQQTRAETVIHYYHRFLARFPDVRALADADIDDVLKLWEGLGYYSRARNLHKAAGMIARELGGTFPTDIPSIRALPGIGQYTAGAIASIAFQMPEPAIDANQIRVLARIFHIDARTDTSDARLALDRAARAWIDRDRPGDFNQALMGLGALLCLPTRWQCDACPVGAYCAARAAHMQGILPVLPEKRGRRTERRAVAIAIADGRVLVRQRPDDALLGGLWEFPNFLDAHNAADVLEALAEMGVRASAIKPGVSAKHVFTHIVWEMRAYLCTDARGVPDGRARFVTADEWARLAMPSAMKPFFPLVREALGGAGARPNVS